MDPDAPCPIPLERSVAAFRLECAALDPVIAALRAPDLERPTRLDGWSLQLLLAHLVRGADRTVTYLAAPVPPRAEVGWLGYWSAAADSDPGAVSQRAAQVAAALNDRPVFEAWRDGWQRSAEEAGASRPERLLLSPFGGMRLDHYLTTRVFELTVHGLDLRAALGLEEVATPLGREVTVAILEHLLGRERPADLGDDVAFILAATGRAPHPDPDLPVVT